MALEDVAAAYAERTGTDPDPEEVTGFLTQHRKINLNHTTADELQTLPFLSARQAMQLWEYLSGYGEVYSFQEFRTIEGFDSLTIRMLSERTILGTKPDALKATPGNMLRHGRHEFVFRYGQAVPRAAGYKASPEEKQLHPDGYFLGSAQEYYFRYRYSFTDKVIIGFSGDKDAGEEFFRGSQPAGFDFYSGFISLQHIRWLDQLIIGNFKISFGQGLTFGGRSIGAGPGFGTSFPYLSGIHPSQSVRESGYLRGACLSLRFGRWRGSGFFSWVNHDAAVSQMDTVAEAGETFSSFTETGYHRTATELSKKGNIREILFGGHFAYYGGSFLVGVGGYHGSYSGVYQPSAKLYKKYALHGNLFGAIGIDTRIRVKNCQLYGEFSRSENGGIAYLAGLFAFPFPGCDFLMSYRNYQRNYQHPYAAALSQNAMSVNENGLFLRVNFQPFSRVTLTGYVDFFRFPWVKYRVSSPSNGCEAGVKCSYQYPQSWSITGRYYMKQQQTDISEEGNPALSSARTLCQDFKAEADCQVTRHLFSRSTVQVRLFRKGKEPFRPGYVVYQDLRYQSPGSRCAIMLRFALFDISSYDSRIYLAEPDVLYGWSAPMFYGRGMRAMLSARVSLTRYVTCWAWGGLTRYGDRQAIGSGPEEISGSIRSEFKIQIRVNL